MAKILRIISGGQTGADRAALDFGLENGIETGGFVPKNRLAEDGRIPQIYSNLKETATEDYRERTDLNVRHSDATLILSHGCLKGGSLLTMRMAEKHKKPFLYVDLSAETVARAAEKTRKWLSSIDCETLNVAGPRASEDEKIFAATKNLLKRLDCF